MLKKFLHQEGQIGYSRFATCALAAAVSLLSVSAFAQTKLVVPAANVSASSNDGNVPANADDGSLVTRWEADATNGAQWIQYNLGGCYSVASANLAWYKGNARQYSFNLQTSVDGNTWTDAFDGANSGTSAGLQSYNASDASAQYVRVLSTGSNVNKFVSLSEMEIYTNGAGTCATSPAAPEIVARNKSLSKTEAPGGNFDLSPFLLELPTGSQGNVTEIQSSQLQGSSGYTNKYYFYTDTSDGSMVMMDPTTGWTTSGSEHPRTELHENATWSTSGTNHLNATVKVSKVPSHTTIGQIFQGTGPSKPLCELQVTSGGTVNLFLEADNTGSSGNENEITTISPGAQFTYELELEDKTITVKINSTTKTFTLPSSFVGEKFFFKAGDYDQTAVSGTPKTTAGTVVQFYALTITH